MFGEGRLSFEPSRAAFHAKKGRWQHHAGRSPSRDGGTEPRMDIRSRHALSLHIPSVPFPAPDTQHPLIRTRENPSRPGDHQSESITHTPNTRPYGKRDRHPNPLRGSPRTGSFNGRCKSHLAAIRRCPNGYHSRVRRVNADPAVTCVWRRTKRVRPPLRNSKRFGFPDRYDRLCRCKKFIATTRNAALRTTTISSIRARRQPVDKPGSVPYPRAWGRPFIWDAAYDAPRATYPNDDPETGLRERRACPRRRSYSVLLPMGFAVRETLPPRRWALAPPFHPGRRPEGPAGGLLSVALSLGAARPPDVIRHRVSVEPGLSSRAPFRVMRERPSDRLASRS